MPRAPLKIPQRKRKENPAPKVAAEVLREAYAALGADDVEMDVGRFLAAQREVLKADR